MTSAKRNSKAIGEVRRYNVCQLELGGKNRGEGKRVFKRTYKSLVAT